MGEYSVSMYQIQTTKYFFIQFKAVGRELSIAFAYHLLKQYNHLLKQYKKLKKKSTNNRIRRLLDNIDLHILHSLNPDGFEIATEGQCYKGTEIGTGRHNANGVSKKKTPKNRKNCHFCTIHIHLF